MNDSQATPRAARPDCQVLVVGAGPTGLVLAADLLARSCGADHRQGRRRGLLATDAAAGAADGP